MSEEKEGESYKRLLPIGRQYDKTVESEWNENPDSEGDIKEILDEMWRDLDEAKTYEELRKKLIWWFRGK